MNLEDIKTIVSKGHSIAGHGSRHYWLSSMNYDSQLNEIKESLKFIESFCNLGSKKWFSYPYGDFDENTIDIMKILNVEFAVTTNWGAATYEQGIYSLSRWDTNHFWNKDKALPEIPKELKGFI